MNRNNYNQINLNKNLNQNDLALLEYLKKQLDEKKDIISKLTSDLNSLEYQVKNSEENEGRLNKRIRDLTEKVNHLGLH
jgi:CII-binding regulator of phage lambda lysogenization HflD